jgi:hypothetical protein
VEFIVTAYSRQSVGYRQSYRDRQTEQKRPCRPHRHILSPSFLPILIPFVSFNSRPERSARQLRNQPVCSSDCIIAVIIIIPPTTSTLHNPHQAGGPLPIPNSYPQPQPQSIPVQIPLLNLFPTQQHQTSATTPQDPSSSASGHFPISASLPCIQTTSLRAICIAPRDSTRH